MAKSREEYINDREFLEFICCEFDKTVNHATLEEMSEFAFGSVEEAIAAFEIRNHKE